MSTSCRQSMLSKTIKCILLSQLGASAIVLANEENTNNNVVAEPKVTTKADTSSTLSTVTVTASSGGVTPSVTQQVIQKSTIFDMKDILQDQPSVSMGGGNGVAQQLYIRNIGENEITFTVDGVPTSSKIFHHQSSFMFGPAVLKTLEVQKGTGSASSGIGVTSGAIRMTTVDAEDMLKEGQNIGGMVGGGYSNNNGWNTSLAAYGRNDNFDGIFMASRVEHKNYEDGDGNEVPYSAVNQQTFLAKVGFNINENNRVSLSHRREKNSGDLPLRANLIGSIGPNFDTNTTQDTTTLSYEGYDLGVEGSEVNAKLYYGNVSDNRRPIGKISPVFSKPIGSKITKHGADLSVLYPVGSHDFVTGVNYRNNKAQATENPLAGAEKKEEYGVFAEMRWDLAPVTLTTGVRYDHYHINSSAGDTVSDGLVSPSVSAIWDINDNFSLNASWSQAIHSPKIEESFLLDFRNMSSNYADDLSAGKAQTAELGFQWKSDNGFLVGASIYDQQIKDYIVYEHSRKHTQKNAGTLKNRGFEANIGYRDDKLKAYLGMSKSNPQLDGKYYGYAVDVIPTGTKYDALVSYQFDNPKLEIGARAHYVSELNYREAGDPTDRIAPAYFTADVFANWQPLSDDSLTINAGILNLTDRNYYSQSNLRSSRFDANDYSKWNPEKGREFRIGLNYKF